MTLAGLFERARRLEDDPDPQESNQILAEFRFVLAEGLDAHQSDLRRFISLAHRFGSHSDVWNATRLLEETQDLDALGRGLQLSAWLHLFPEAARNNHNIALQLLSPAGKDRLPNAVLSGILSRWLESSFKIALHTNDPWTHGQTLLAAAKLGKTWWPISQWFDTAPGFASSFLDGARFVVNESNKHQDRSLAGLTEVFTTAFLLGSLLQERNDFISEVETAEGLSEEDKLLSRDEQRAKLISSLNNARGRIWVVGALRIKWQHLLGIVKTYGLKPGLFVHVGYDELKSRSIAERVNPVTDLGVMLGPIPHSVVDLGGYSSLSTKLQQETGLIVIELRSQSVSQELKVSKQSFRSGLDRMLDTIAVPTISG